MGQWRPIAMTAPALSICIPVYNCGAYLPAALDSILAQRAPDIEVVVYDGGSTDDTPAVMQTYARLGVRYLRAAARGGIDADLAACVAAASGEYCWLFSGDDVMRPGALARAREWLRGGADVIVCRHTICDIAMRVQYDYDVLRPAGQALEVQFADARQRRLWFERAATSEAFFSFLSGIVVRRAAWERGRTHPAFATSCWAHAERLLALAHDSQGLRVSHAPEIWLDQRGDNDSFAHAGVVNRYRIAIDGWQSIAAALFGPDSPEAFHVRRVLRREFKLEMFLAAKLRCARDPQRESRAELDRLYAKLHSDPSPRSAVLRAAYRLTPLALFAAVRALVRSTRRAVRRDR
jgi:abequosyltransferase